MDDKNLNMKIDSLVDELSPVKRIFPPKLRAFLFIVANLLMIGSAMLALSPIRPTLYQEMTNNLFQLEIVLFITSFIITSYFSFLAIIPGGIRRSRVKFIFIPLLALITLLFYQMIFNEVPSHISSKRSACEIEIIVASLIPLAQFIYFLRQDYFSQGIWSYIPISLCSTLIPAFLIHFMCQKNYQHILVIHFGTVFFTSLIFVMLIKYIRKSSDH